LCRGQWCVAEKMRTLNVGPIPVCDGQKLQGIITDRDTPGASAVAASMEDVRGLLTEQPRPGGPVR